MRCIIGAYKQGGQTMEESQSLKNTAREILAKVPAGEKRELPKAAGPAIHNG
jgi:hypothetical protein